MMELIRHLAWRDLRSQRVPLLVWAAVLALQATVILVNPTRQPRLLNGLGVPVLRYLMTALVAALIIQRDALVGTTAFWLTRPIPRTTFFVSKLVSLAAVLIAVPWLVVFVVWWSTGALTEDAVRAATAVAIEQGVVALLAVRRRARAIRATLALDEPPRRRLLAPLAALLTAGALLALAAAQPVVEWTRDRDVRTDADAFIVLDVSR